MGTDGDDFEYRPLEDSPRAMLVLWICLSFVVVAGICAGEALLRDVPLEPWWGTTAVGVGAYAAAAGGRAAFPWRPPGRGWWVPFASIATLFLVRIVVRSLLGAGTPGAYGFVLFLGLLFGYTVGLGIARLRVLPDGPPPRPFPRFVWQLRTPTPDWRRARGEPPDPPYGGG